MVKRIKKMLKSFHKLMKSGRITKVVKMFGMDKPSTKKRII
jgi:hypothetical protein